MILMENNYTVYIHISPNNMRYIGITCKKPEYRWNHGKGYIKNKHFYNSIKKNGWSSFKHIIISQNISKKEACKLEQEMIKKYDTTNPDKGYNHSIGGESGSLGVKHTPEQIAKWRKNRVYGPSWAKGKHFTEEHKRKIAESRRGIRPTLESRKKMRLAKLGKPQYNKRGLKWSDESKAKKSKPVVCIETKKRYFGLMEAERKTGISHSNISNVIKGKRKMAGGYHWRFAQ